MLRLGAQIDFVEIIVDEWGGNVPSAPCMDTLGDMPFVLHAAICSLGSQFPSEASLRLLRALCHQLKPSWVSEHISFSKAGEFDINNFMPVEYSVESARSLAARAHALSQELSGRPIALENTCYFFGHPGNQMTEQAYLGELAARDVPIVLDVNNLYVNSVNFGYDPMQFIKYVARTCRVAYVHVAGHRTSEGWLLDSHDVAVSEEVWGLAEEALKSTSAEGIVIERDHNSATIDELLDEIDRARNVWIKGKSHREPSLA